MTTKTQLVTLESQTPVGDFDVIAFSVSFEWDYVNVLTLLRLAGVPRYAAERSHRHPLVMIGGAVTFVNPEPLAPVRRRDRCRRRRSAGAGVRSRVSRGDGSDGVCCTALAAERGFYIPSLLRAAVRRRWRTDADTPWRPAPRRALPVRKAAVTTTEALDPPATNIFTPDTEFGSRFLVEVVRGCANLCRFCWAGYNYLPVRAFPADRILELAEAARRIFVQGGAGLDCALRSSRNRPDPGAAARDGLRHQPGVAPPRRSDRVDRPGAARQRRAKHHDRPRDRIRPPAPRGQQDRDQRRDPRPGRADLRQRHREPEAVLHDRAADGDRRGSRRDSRSDRCRCAIGWSRMRAAAARSDGSSAASIR